MKRANLNKYQSEMDSYYLEFDNLIAGAGKYLSEIRIPMTKKSNEKIGKGILKIFTKKKMKKDSGNSNVSLPDPDAMVGDALSPCEQALNLYLDASRKIEKLTEWYQGKWVLMKKRKLEILREDKKYAREKFMEFCRTANERIGSFESKINIFWREDLLSSESAEDYQEFIAIVKGYIDKIKPAYSSKETQNLYKAPDK